MITLIVLASVGYMLIGALVLGVYGSVHPGFDQYGAPSDAKALLAACVWPLSAVAWVLLRLSGVAFTATESLRRTAGSNGRLFRIPGVRYAAPPSPVIQAPASFNAEEEDPGFVPWDLR